MKLLEGMSDYMCENQGIARRYGLVLLGERQDLVLKEHAVTLRMDGICAKVTVVFSRYTTYGTS